MSTEFFFKNGRFECHDKQRYSLDALSVAAWAAQHILRAFLP